MTDETGGLNGPQQSFTEVKKCNHCNKILPASSFLRRKTGKKAGMLNYVCNDCNKKLRRKDWAENNEHHKAVATAWRESNKDKIQEYSRTAYYKDVEKSRQHNKETYEKRKDKIKGMRPTIAKQFRASFVKYSLGAPKVDWADKCREDVNGMLEVQCSLCEQWFKPTHAQLEIRIKSLNDASGREGRFYCSDACKESCPIFGRIVHKKGERKYYSRVVQPELRQMVLDRDNYSCQICGAGKEANLHCHHIEGINLNPIESADMDNCITLCKKCHKKVHRLPGCSLQELKCSKAT